MFKNIYLKATLLSSILLFIACDKDDAPEAENEMEVFTAAVIVVTNLFDNSSVIYEFEVEGHEHEDHEEHGVLNGSLIQNQEEDDEHGDHIEIELESYTDYKFEISFINESDPDNPIDLTTEVSEEAEDHHVHYELTGNEIEIVSYDGDTIDKDGFPLNLVTKWKTSTATEIEVKAYLIHKPVTKIGSTRMAFGGATDVELDFEAHVE